MTNQHGAWCLSLNSRWRNNQSAHSPPLRAVRQIISPALLGNSSQSSGAISVCTAEQRKQFIQSGVLRRNENPCLVVVGHGAAALLTLNPSIINRRKTTTVPRSIGGCSAYECALPKA